MTETALWLALSNGIIAALMFQWGRNVGRKDNPWRKR